MVAARDRQLAVQESLQIGLDEADLRSNGARGDIAGENHLTPVRGIEQFLRVAAVSQQRARELRQPDLREQPIDQPGLVVG
jgi:hypothetical protein